MSALGVQTERYPFFSMTLILSMERISSKCIRPFLPLPSSISSSKGSLAGPEAEIVLQKQRYSYYKDKFFEGIDKKYYVPLKTIAKQERGKNKGQLIKEAFSVTQKGIIRTSDYFGNDTKITSENTSNYYVVKPGWFAYHVKKHHVD